MLAGLGCGSQVVVEGTTSGAGGSLTVGGNGATSSTGGDQEFREAFGFLTCTPTGGDLLIEIPLEPWDGCVPPQDAAIDSLVVLAIEDWSGEAGTWTFDEQTPSGAAGGNLYGVEATTGELTIAPLASDGSLTVVRWTADWENGQARVTTCGAATCN